MDIVLLDRAQAALSGNPHLARKQLKVEARTGRVTVQGVVGSYYQKQMAQETLRKLEGVEAVENLLEVRWDEAAGGSRPLPAATRAESRSFND
jgi:osmotically-inducible protein OsmY